MLCRGADFFQAQFFNQASCGGSSSVSLIASNTGTTVSGTPGAFDEHLSGRQAAPATALSTRCAAQVQTRGPGSMQGWVDHILLVEDDIFTAGFQ